ncbi:unnamed protein product [Urochloa humidicola]
MGAAGQEAVPFVGAEGARGWGRGRSQAVLAAGTGSGASPSRFSRLPSTGLSRPPRKSGPKKKVVGDCPETSNSEAAVTCLPDDALVEILSYLRAKTLCRFKCVSKDWCRLITDILLRRKSLQTLQGFFYGSGDNYGDFADLPGGSAPPFDRSLSFLTQQVGIQHIFLLDSCNGLLLFGHRNTMTWFSMGYIVCNPTTEQWVAVPSSEEYEPFEQVSSHTYLIFEPTISSEFNLLQLWPTPVDIRVRTYSSESGVWTHRANRWDYSSMGYSGGIVNGMLHFVIPSTHDGQDQIVVIDVEGNIHKTIQAPENNGFLAFVGLSQGHLHCIKSHLTEATELSIWALEDYDAGEWVLKHTVSILELFGRMSCKLYFCFNVIAIHPDRNLVFFDQHWNHELISYDMDRKEVCALMTPEEIEKYTLDFGTEGFRTYRAFIPYIPYLP